MTDKEQKPQNPTPENQGPSCCSTGSSSCGCGSNLKWIILAAIFLVIIMIYKNSQKKVPTDEHGAPDVGIAWQQYDQALKNAAANNQPILLAFHAEWCGPCKYMAGEVYPKENVKKTMEKFIPVYVDIDKKSELADKYQVSGIPTYIVLNSKAEPVDQFSGGQEPAEFMMALENALKKTQQ